MLNTGNVACRYDRTNAFRTMVDCQFVAAMGPPGGGRAYITPRYARHFHTIGVCAFDAKAMQRIFGTILDWSFSRVRLPNKRLGVRVCVLL